jgi:soluble lytic murein transglycosylase-like protein
MSGKWSVRWNRMVVAAVVGSIAAATSAFGQSLPPQSLLKKAKRYELANGAKRDYKKAFRLYCQALKQGQEEASYHIGMLYYFGRGVKRDQSLAMGWFHRGAEHNDRYAQIMLKLHPTMKPKRHDSCRQSDVVHRHRSVKRKQIESWVHEIAKHHSIDPKLVLAVIEAESGFNAQALSPKNASGLMQLTPSTAVRFGIKDVWDPYQNIQGGTAYLHWLLRHFSGDLPIMQGRTPCTSTMVFPRMTRHGNMSSGSLPPTKKTGTLFRLQRALDRRR